jgi:putative ABC transport system permease protein
VQRANWVNDFSKVTVIGVREDYKLNSFFVSADNNPDGVALVYRNFSANTDVIPMRKISLKLNTRDIAGTIAKVGERYNATFPGNVFSWNFLDQQIGIAYAKERTSRNQILFFTALAIVIACIGLLGMITHKVMEKTKEMGVRQVLGAEFHQLAMLLLRTTFVQLALAIVIGIPAAWMLNRRYLEKFSERIPQQWWHYALPAAVLVTLMMFTVTYTIVKAARTSPVRSLRYE